MTNDTPLRKMRPAVCDYLDCDNCDRKTPHDFNFSHSDEDTPMWRCSKCRTLRKGNIPAHDALEEVEHESNASLTGKDEDGSTKTGKKSLEDLYKESIARAARNR